MHEFDISHVPRTSQELAGEGEDSWVSALYREHASAIFAFLCQRTTVRADAEDLLLEVFTAALEQPDLEHLNQERQVTWLWRVARNKAVDYHRRAARRPALDFDRVDDFAAAVEGGLPENDALRRDEYHQLHTHLGTLTPLQRDVLRLRFAEGLCSGEIALALGRREAAVRALLTRALRSLRAIYAQQEGGDPHDTSGHAL